MIRQVWDSITDKARALRAAKHAGVAQELAEMKNNGATNTFVPSKERARKATRKKMAKESRRRNRNH